MSTLLPVFHPYNLGPARHEILTQAILMAFCPSRYPISKLLLYYAVREIAVRSPLSTESNVVITCLTPGYCVSTLLRPPLPWYHRAGNVIALSLLARSTEAGSRALVDGIRPDIGAEAHGRFLQNCRVAEYVTFFHHSALCLLNFSQRCTGLLLTWLFLLSTEMSIMLLVRRVKSCNGYSLRSCLQS